MYYCNPINIEYKYQRFPNDDHDHPTLYREAADPTLIYFMDQYMLFPSVSGGFYTSTDLCNWTFHKFPFDMPIYDYAPDVCVIGDYLYYTASASDENCSFYRTTDPFTKPFEEITGTFPFWDPHLFRDDDGRLYFYWGCSNESPLYGVELDANTLTMIGTPQLLMELHPHKNGYERVGDDNVAPLTDTEILQHVQQAIESFKDPQDIREINRRFHDLRRQFSYDPWLEGAWTNKIGDTYYLQYACPATEYNIYCDGVYTAKSPLGPFVQAPNNPFSYQPGGFMTGAGHGSTVVAPDKRLWHISSSQISVNHIFERRLGLWKSGVDADGELYCDQRFGNWPINRDAPTFSDPDWMLLSYHKPVKASSGTNLDQVVDENAKTWWTAADNTPEQWVEVDLTAPKDVRAIQINFADCNQYASQAAAGLPEAAPNASRYIELRQMFTRWQLEGSLDGNNYFMIKDNSSAQTDLSHDCWIDETGIKAQYIRLTIKSLPYDQVPTISGIRVFGISDGKLPDSIDSFTTKSLTDEDMLVSWPTRNQTGVVISWGHRADKLYHSRTVIDQGQQVISTLVQGQPVFMQIDAFNEAGVTHGTVRQVRS